MVIKNDLKYLVLLQDDCVGVRSVDYGFRHELFACAEDGENGWYHWLFVCDVVEECIVLSRHQLR